MWSACYETVNGKIYIPVTLLMVTSSCKRVLELKSNLIKYASLNKCV